MGRHAANQVANISGQLDKASHGSRRPFGLEMQLCLPESPKHVMCFVAVCNKAGFLAINYFVWTLQYNERRKELAPVQQPPASEAHHKVNSTVAALDQNISIIDTRPRLTTAAETQKQQQRNSRSSSLVLSVLVVVDDDFSQSSNSSSSSNDCCCYHDSTSDVMIGTVSTAKRAIKRTLFKLASHNRHHYGTHLK
jgi:hypothetical protein